MNTSDPSTAIVLSRAVRAEWARLWTLRSMWLLMLMGATAIVGFSTLLGLDAVASSSAEAGVAVWIPIRRVCMLAMLLLLPMATVGATADYGTGGIVPTMQWTPRREVLLASRSAVVVGAVTATALIPALAGAALLTRLTSTPSWSWSAGADALATVGFVSILGALIAVGIGLLLRSTAASIGALLAVVLVLPLLLGNLPFAWTKDLAAMLPGTSARQLLIGEGLPGLTDTDAQVALVAWAVGAVGLGAWRLLRTDASA